MMELSNRMVCTLTPKKLVIITVCIGFGVIFCAMHSPSLMYTNSHSENGIHPPTTTNPIPHDRSMQQGVDQHSHAEQRFPQALIIGVRKGGTRALIDMLKSHPQIKSAKGEVHFFDKDEMFLKGVDWYIKKMPYTTPDQITIEKSPSYFVTPEAPQRIHHLSPTVKLILIVRDPIERAVSDYSQLFNPSRKQRNLTFDDFVLNKNRVDSGVSVIKVSTYDIHMVKWLRYFPLHQIHVANGDALILDPAPEIIRVQQFLGVSSFFEKDMFYYNKTKGFYCWQATRKGHRFPSCLGSAKGRPHPKISSNTRELLKQYFNSHNERFFELVKQRFDWNH